MEALEGLRQGILAELEHAQAELRAVEAAAAAAAAGAQPGTGRRRRAAGGPGDFIRSLHDTLRLQVLLVDTVAAELADAESVARDQSIVLTILRSVINQGGFDGLGGAAGAAGFGPAVRIARGFAHGAASARDAPGSREAAGASPCVATSLVKQKGVGGGAGGAGAGGVGGASGNLAISGPAIGTSGASNAGNAAENDPSVGRSSAKRDVFASRFTDTGRSVNLSHSLSARDFSAPFDSMHPSPPAAPRSVPLDLMHEERGDLTDWTASNASGGSGFLTRTSTTESGEESTADTAGGKRGVGEDVFAGLGLSSETLALLRGP